MVRILAIALVLLSAFSASYAVSHPADAANSVACSVFAGLAAVMMVVIEVGDTIIKGLKRPSLKQEKSESDEAAPADSKPVNFDSHGW